MRNNFSMIRIRCRPGFSTWAKAVLKPETYELIHRDQRSCLQVHEAYIYALSYAGCGGTNSDYIPVEAFAATKRKRSFVDRPIQKRS